MTVYISLLRGINVGGSKILSMAALCDIYTSLGFTGVRTYLQSGNVIFASPPDDLARLASQIEQRIEQECDFYVAVFLRQVTDFQHILASNPFVEQAKAEPGKLHVSFLYRAPAEEAWSKLVVPADIPDKLARTDLALYLHYPNGAAKTKLSTAYLEKLLGVPITDRNWNTVSALYKIATEI